MCKIPHSHSEQHVWTTTSNDVPAHYCGSLHPSFVWKLAVRQSVIEKRSILMWVDICLHFQVGNKGKEEKMWVIACVCLPSDAEILFFKADFRLGFIRLNTLLLQDFCFFYFYLLCCPQMFFFWQLLLSGLIAIWPTYVKREKFYWLLPFQEDFPLHEAAVCSSAKAVREAVFFVQSLSLDLLWRFLSVVKTPALVTFWATLPSFHFIIMYYCVISANNKLLYT